MRCVPKWQKNITVNRSTEQPKPVCVLGKTFRTRRRIEVVVTLTAYAATKFWCFARTLRAGDGRGVILCCDACLRMTIDCTPRLVTHRQSANRNNSRCYSVLTHSFYSQTPTLISAKRMIFAQYWGSYVRKIPKRLPKQVHHAEQYPLCCHCATSWCYESLPHCSSGVKNPSVRWKQR